MILTRLDTADRYAACHPLFSRALEFVRRPDLATLADGRHEIVDDRMFAIVARDLGRGRSDAILEYHRHSIDIQYVVSGFDLIGWTELSECRQPKAPYDRERDLGFFLDRPRTWLRVPAGSLAVFFPEDAHAPLGASGPIHKLVLKVAAE